MCASFCALFVFARVFPMFVQQRIFAAIVYSKRFTRAPPPGFAFFWVATMASSDGEGSGSAGSWGGFGRRDDGDGGSSSDKSPKPQGRGRKGKKPPKGGNSPIKKVTAKRATHGKGKTKAKETCFVIACKMNKKRNSRFCAQHSKVDAGMKYQAHKKGSAAVAAYEQVMRNAETATTAVEDWEKVNGTDGGRKALIDWGKWEKKFGVKVTKRERQKKVLMDFIDFEEWQEKRKLPPLEIKRKWTRLCNDVTIEAEGEGASKKLWLDTVREKHVDKEIYEDGAFVEGSNVKKYG